MTKVVRNPFPYPLIKEEEDLQEPLALPGYEYDWETHVNTYDRLYLHHTLASIRQDRRLKHPHAPKDSLDYHLNSIYDHSACRGDEKIVCLQPDTVSPGLGHRLFKNKRIVQLVRPARDLLIEEDADKVIDNDTRLPGTRWLGVRYGGTAEKRSPFSVKLGITSNHGPQSNAGYSRKQDGTYYSS